MYVRQLGYTIRPGQEEKAAALCSDFAQTLCERGIEARILVGSGRTSTLQLVEQYASLEAMHDTRAALETDEGYRSALSRWAMGFYPLVQAAAPAAVLRHQAAA